MILSPWTYPSQEYEGEESQEYRACGRDVLRGIVEVAHGRDARMFNGLTRIKMACRLIVRKENPRRHYCKRVKVDAVSGDVT